jgi:predicted Zn-dependent protease
MKRKRIWIIILLGLLLVGGAGAYVGGRYVMKRRLQSWRDQGIAASIAGDHEKAATLLGRYVQRYSGDTRALRYYITSREQAELPNGQHLTDTLAALKLLVQEEPDDVDAKRHLLELYVKLERRPEAVTAADAVLKADAKDLRALELKSQVQARLLQYREALTTVDRWLELAPLDLKAHMARLSLRHQLQNPGDALVAEAAKLGSEHPSDARFELLQGYAYALWADEERVDPQVQAERQKQAADWFKKAAAHKNPTDEFVAILVEQFDNLGMSDDSMGTLQQMARSGGSPAVHHTLARRFWQLGKWDQAAAELADVSATDPKSDSTLLALKSIALANLNKKHESEACRAALAGRNNQAAARAWGLLLRQVIDATPVDSKQVVTECRSALSSDPKNSYLVYYLGDAQARLGDLDPAIQSWSYASQVNLTWAVPPARLVDALIQKGRPEEAIGVAVAAKRRNPGNSVAELSLARAAAVGVDVGSGTIDPEKLYTFAAGVQSQAPGEDTTLLIQVDLLSRQGKTGEAAKIIKAAAARSPAPSEALLLRLAAMSRRSGLGVEQDCLAASEKAHGVTPNLAYAHALDRWLAGKPDEGLASFDALAQRAGNSSADARWRLARAKYLDATSNPAAPAAWVALGDAFPKELFIQQAAAGAQCVRSDWDFEQRTIDRLRTLTGNNALGWRLAKARLMIESPRKDSGDVEQGSVLLTEILKDYSNIPEPHVLLARALVQMKRVEGAIDHLSIAAKLEPFSVPIALQLAGLCQSKGDFDRARKEIDRVMPQIRTPEQRHAAAMLLARQGNDDQALQILQKPQILPAGQAKDAPEDLLLAAIYRQRHDYEKVDAVLKNLLEKPDVATIEFAASFYASQSRPADAERALALLDGMKLDPGLKEMVWGRYKAGAGDLPEAIKHYQNATAQAPANPTAWQMLALCDASAGRVDDALAAVDAGSKALPNDKALAAARSRTALLKQIGPDGQLRPLAVLVLRDPLNSDTAAELLQTLLEERQSDDVQRLASRLQQLVERHPEFLPAQLQLVQCLLSMNRPSDALTVAQRAITAFPNSPEPAAMAARVSLATARWNEAAAAADAWKKRSLDNPLPADLAIAQAQIGLNQDAAAITQLQPYQQAAASDPDKYADVITVRSAALVRSGQLQPAQDILWPLAQKSSAWRVRFLQVAGQIPDRRQAVSWVDRLGEIVPHHAPQERVMLAEAYDQLGISLGDARLTSLASEIYAQLASDPKAPAVVVLATAARAERHADLGSAEALYRRAIALDPSLWIAQNNLAMLIVNRGGNAKEAAPFAAAAARLQPRQPAVRDTLADIEHKAGDLKGAADSENAAVRLDPDNIKWKVRFAQYVLDAGNVAEAERTLQTIESNGDALSRLPQPEQQALAAQLAGVKKRLHAPKAM